MPSLLFDDRKLLSEKTLTLLVPGGGGRSAPPFGKSRQRPPYGPN